MFAKSYECGEKLITHEEKYTVKVVINTWGKFTLVT